MWRAAPHGSVLHATRALGHLLQTKALANEAYLRLIDLLLELSKH